MSAQYTPADAQVDPECSRCLGEKVASYAIKYPNWSEEQQRKYAISKCPCRNESSKRDSDWVHLVTYILLAALGFVALYLLLR